MPSFLTSSPQTVLRIVVLGIWDYIENKIEVKTSVPRTPLTQPSWKLETITVLSVPGREPSTKASSLPHWTHESVQLCLWVGGEGRQLRKFPVKEYGLKYLLEVLQNLKSYS